MAIQLTGKSAKFAVLSDAVIDRLVQKATDLFNSYLRDKVRLGEVLLKIHNGVEHGKWMKLLERIGIPDRSARQFIADYESFLKIPTMVVEVLDKAGFPVTNRRNLETAADFLLEHGDNVDPKKVVDHLRAVKQKKQDDEQTNAIVRSKPFKIFDLLGSPSKIEGDFTVYEAVSEVTKCVASLVSKFSAQDKDTTLRQIIRNLQDELERDETNVS